MSRLRISQAQARIFKSRAEKLQREKEMNANAWASDYIGGAVNINTITVSNCDWHIVMTARKLGHAIIVLPSQNGKTELRVYAVKP